ncbi:MAG: LCP family protein [Clostridia bacterium]|nr:LCP family protein [Clostridia bacterium]
MSETIKNQKNNKRKLLLLIPLGVVAFLAVCAAAAFAWFALEYNEAYEPVDIVERSDTYQLPDYPDVSIGSDSIEVTDATTSTEVPATVSPVTEATSAPDTSVQGTEEQTATAPQTTDPWRPPSENFDKNEDTDNVTDSASDTTTEPEPVVTYPPIQYDSKASFANSESIVSIYSSIPIYKVAQKNSNVINILVMGTDTRDPTLERGRSDTMIIVSYNKTTGSVKLTSLMRDSLVPIEYCDWDRISSAYAYGGVGLAINTVNQVFDMDIQSFVLIDFNGVRNFIDHIGGVDVYLTAEEAEYYVSTHTYWKLSEGVNHLNSDQALMHMRNRTIGSDFERTRRQRDVMTAVVQSVFKERSLTEIYGIVDYTFSLVKTNIPATTLASLAASVAGQKNSLTIQTQNVPYNDTYEFAWYQGMAVIYFDIMTCRQRLHSFIYN